MSEGSEKAREPPAKSLPTGGKSAAGVERIPTSATATKKKVNSGRTNEEDLWLKLKEYAREDEGKWNEGADEECDGNCDGAAAPESPNLLRRGNEDEFGSECEGAPALESLTSVPRWIKENKHFCSNPPSGREYTKHATRTSPSYGCWNARTRFEEKRANYDQDTRWNDEVNDDDDVLVAGPVRGAEGEINYDSYLRMRDMSVLLTVGV